MSLAGKITNTRKQCIDVNLINTPYFKQEEQTTIPHNSKVFFPSKSALLQPSDIFDLVDIQSTIDVSNKKQSPILVNPYTNSIPSRLSNIQSTFESLYLNRQLSEHGLESENAIVNAIDAPITE